MLENRAARYAHRHPPHRTNTTEQTANERAVTKIGHRAQTDCNCSIFFALKKHP